MAIITVSVTGVDPIIRKITPPTMFAPILGRTVERIGLATEAEVKLGSPVDTSRLRSDVKHRSFVTLNGFVSQVSTNVRHAKPMEYGTGLLSEAPGASRQRHRPSPRALADWSRRHGLNPFAVAAAIAKRGGLRPRRMFRGAAERIAPKIPAFIAEMAREIEREWRR